MSIQRPAQLRQRLASVLLSLSFTCAWAEQASTPLPAVQTSQAPGFFRLAVGPHTVTALYDGHIQIAPALLKGRSAKDIQSLLARMFLQTEQGMQTAVNAFLVHTGKNLVLVDAGAAQCFGPTMGNIVANIRASGYQPEDVDTVLLTHLHADHTCGLVLPDGQPVFPNATVWASQADADYWLSPKEAEAAPTGRQPLFKMAQNAVAPYQKAERFKTYRTGDAIVDGFSVVPSPGHTPGHSSYLFDAGQDSLLIWGDIVHAHAVQMAHPEVSIEFDTNPRQAIESRKDVFRQAAGKRWWVAGAHLPFPGIGHVRQDAKGHAWVPVEFGPLPSAPKK